MHRACIVTHVYELASWKSVTIKQENATERERVRHRETGGKKRNKKIGAEMERIWKRVRKEELRKKTSISDY